MQFSRFLHHFSGAANSTAWVAHNQWQLGASNVRFNPPLAKSFQSATHPILDGAGRRAVGCFQLAAHPCAANLINSSWRNRPYGDPMDDESTIKIRPHRVKGSMVDQAMLMPSAAAVAAQMVAVPAGAVRSVAEVRARLAEEHGVEATCPVTTQRMIKIVAAKSVADHQAGRQAVPFWRVVDPDRPNGASLPGGRDFILARRKEESR